MKSAIPWRTAGSSPLTRGKRDRGGGGRHRHRLIPAHAGKTCHPRRRLHRRRAHPRSRGENPGQMGTGIVGAGSSPLTRGKPHPLKGPHHAERLIPAHAGKTLQGGHPVPVRQAHPRSRGENHRAVLAIRRAAGSSPLTRGKLAGFGLTLGLAGLIPAHAGKTPPPRRQGWTPPAHPRSRGENSPSRMPPCSHTGSSPLTRGKLGGNLHARLDIGLIPAHAGKTGRSAPRGPGGRAHPRSRGENARRTPRP